MFRLLPLLITVLSIANFCLSVIFWGAEIAWPVIIGSYFLIIAPILVSFRKILIEQENDKNTKSRRFIVEILSFLIPASLSILAIFNKTLFRFSIENQIAFCGSYFSTIVLSVHIIALVFALYLLENMYRYALLYQRRIGWVSFVGFLVIVSHQLLFSTRWLLYGWVPVIWLQFAAYLYIPALFALPWSFVRYRVKNEKIKVTRDAVYSSFSLLIVGALFTAVGITTSILRSFKIVLSPLDFKVIVMSTLFAGTILAGSARMRRRVAKLVNRRLYSNRYDYRSQFFSLHRILGKVEGFEETIEELLENLRRSLNADHAYLFIANDQNGNFELRTPKETNLPESVVINNNSPLVRTLNNKGDYFGLLRINSDMKFQVNTKTPEDFYKLNITDAAPVFNFDNLLAILALRRDNSDALDIEATALVEAYASVIADYLFKHRILRERLEQKQFESFSHMASFIVHDVKNQVATLKLLLRNAQQNISNPRFQESLLISLGNCTENLSGLVSKLSMPPRADRLKISRIDLSLQIKKIIEDTSIQLLSELDLQSEIANGIWAETDESALYYAIKNLIINALESMGNKGKLTIRVDTVKPSIALLTSLFSGGEAFFLRYSSFIMIQDSGCGMSEEFLKERLFRPFSTTKDKGIGIGLYQCKTLIEQMDGKILCDSHVGRGTTFCVLL